MRKLSDSIERGLTFVSGGSAIRGYFGRTELGITFDALGLAALGTLPERAAGALLHLVETGPREAAIDKINHILYSEFPCLSHPANRQRVLTGSKYIYPRGSVFKAMTTLIAVGVHPVEIISILRARGTAL